MSAARSLGIVTFTVPGLLVVEFLPRQAVVLTDRLGQAAGVDSCAVHLLPGKLDPDRVILCVGFHRNPLAHSALPLPFFAGATGFQLRLVLFFALGRASHLSWDARFSDNLT